MKELQPHHCQNRIIKPSNYRYRSIICAANLDRVWMGTL